MKLSHPRISKVIVLAQYIMKKDTWEFNIHMYNTPFLLLDQNLLIVAGSALNNLASYNDIFTPLF